VKWDISIIYNKLLPHAGLFLTYLALFLMDGHGQPALLYLVPCTLGKYGHCSLDFVIIMVSFTLRTGVIVIDALSFHSCTRAYCYPWLGKRWPTWLVELRKRSNWKRGRWTLRSEILTNDTGLLVTSIIQSTDLLGQYQRCIELPWLKSFYVSFLLCYNSVVLMYCYG